MNRTLIVLWILSLSSLLIHCGEDEGPISPIEPISELKVTDRGNNGDASDIAVYFKKQDDLERVVEYRVFVLKKDQPEMTIETALEIPSSNYFRINKDRVILTRGLGLESNVQDAMGDPVSERIPYRIAVMSVANNGSASVLTYYSEIIELRVTNMVVPFSPVLKLGSEDGFGPGCGGLSIDNEGNIYMGNFGISPINALAGETIIKIDANGKESVFAEGVLFPGGNAFDSQGNLYQSNHYNGIVSKVSIHGSVSEFADITELEGGFGNTAAEPDGIFIDELDNLFVADCLNGRVVKVSTDGSVVVFASTGGCPKGITRDQEGNFYVSDNSESGTIWKIDPNGEVIEFTDIPVYKDPDYLLEYKMWLGHLTYRSGYLYVAGTSTHRIYKVDMNGNVEVFAGSGILGDTGGATMVAELNRPMDIVFNENGDKMFVNCSNDTEPTHTQIIRPARIWEIQLLE